MPATFTWSIPMTEYTNDADQGVVVAHYRVDGVDGEYTTTPGRE